ncbi:hypothetical protein K450DRAFT_133636 [Umbelopsis ramanniana AG]|uniref:ATP-dependent RNA helicase n=1 Tax=Umbelopsis ramanniana AG TaxID=1314678 RepID=A0AAD5E2B8_UMBRA|nr:uncharacterized protein K450DRAFT_133636 [Umbelopsis ramanniana AG]KAI8575903.1 hypothetical protein K450DRAFT_133636 [Umbelopsis ramanniana AG]
MATVPSYAGEWSSLEVPLTGSTKETLDAMGFTQMTPVQAAAIPLFMKNKDVVVEAVTGSGKTLSFVIPVIEKLMRREYILKNNEIGAVIITPTRELATQINTVFEIFIKDHPKKKQLSHALYIGGTTTLAEDVANFKTEHPRILIGTPGRLEEMLTKTAKLINTKELEMLVLDEADRLLDMGFSQQLSSIIANLPKQRRTGLFSATMTDAITELVRAGLRNPVRVVVKVEDLENQGKEQRTPASLKINYLVCDPDQKMAQVVRLLLKELDDFSYGAKKFIIYFATCASVDYFYKIMSKLTQLKPFSIHSLHGQMDTKRRTATYSSFVGLPAATPALLLCTDVASRGLDIPDVDYVVQFDPPQDPKAFSHRCGRTARAGRNGKATVFLNRGREEVYVEFLKLRKIPMEPAPYLMNDLSEHPQAAPQNDDEKPITPEIPDPSIPTFIQEMRQIVKTDRDLHDKSFKAFTSFIRAYSKHDASYIFRVKDLDLGKAATGFGLLRLPKMPELKGKTNVAFEEENIDWDNFKFLDKSKEAKRVKELEEYKKSIPAPKQAKPKYVESL